MLEWIHISLFGITVGGCAVAVWRARTIRHAETRIGLVGLLITSGLWAAAQLITLLDVSLTTATVAYQLGLIPGLATVGAWLYFCSAYTGHEYHRVRTYRYAAITVFASIISLKLTNPIHQQYFTIELTTTPFPHANVVLLELHWAVTVLAYSLTAVGFYMLFQTFVRSEIETRLLGVLVSLTALPVIFNVLSIVGVPWLVNVNYEPIGVAFFALGTLYVASDSFENVRWTNQQQLLDNISEGVLVIDDENRIQSFNAAAEALFEGISVGDVYTTLLPDHAGDSGQPSNDASVHDGRTIAIDGDENVRYYLLNTEPVTIGPTRSGRTVVISDITPFERKRRRVEQQSEQMEGLAAAIGHELRNVLTKANGNLHLSRELTDADNDEKLRELLGEAADATSRASTVVDDLVIAAKFSLPVTKTSRISVEPTVQRAFSLAGADSVSLVVADEWCIEAEESRWIELIKNVSRLTTAMDASELAVSRGEGKITFRADGVSLPTGDTEALFEYGSPVPCARAGMLGPNIRALAHAHGWEVSATLIEPDGIEINVTGITDA